MEWTAGDKLRYNMLANEPEAKGCEGAFSGIAGAN
jgi:hypothetical protein